MNVNDNQYSEIRSIWNEAKGHVDRGEYEKAIEIYKYILIRYADDVVAVEYANAYLGDIFLTIEHLDQAERYLKKAIALAPEKAQYHYLLGFTYSKTQIWNKAILGFRRALKIDPDNAEYERGLGWAIFNKGQKVDGLVHLERALDLCPSNVNVITDLGAAMLMYGKIEIAKKFAERALKIDPYFGLAKELLKTINRLQRKQG
jgi:tetratricopeptide (TPR) repeat protein